MSGHSKWSQIKRQKAAADNKRGSLFTKLGNAISIAVKQGGKDPETNFKLRIAVEKAKSSNMPNDTIERAIKRGAGELEGSSIEEVTYEAYGPGGVALVIQTATDNKNRTAADLRHMLTKLGGNLGSTNSVLWMFDQKGVVRIPQESVQDRDALEMTLIESGAEDIREETEGLIVLTPPSDLPNIKEALEQKGVSVASADIELVPQNTVTLTDAKEKDRLEKLYAQLEESDDVNNYFTNADE